jgi:hypothetical protein
MDIRQETSRPYQPQQEPKEKLFVTFNRIPRYHRLVLASKLIQSNLLSLGHCSFDLENMNDLVKNRHYINVRSLPDQVIQTLDILHENHSLFPMKLNRTPERDNPIDFTLDDIYYHTSSYFSIVTETVFFQKNNSGFNFFADAHDIVFISEKIYKPIVYKHPFVWFAYP